MGVKLLADIRFVFQGEDKLFSEELCTGLVQLEESPWGEMPFGARRGKEIDPRTLAYYLRQYGVRPKQIRKYDDSKKGYTVHDFQDVWDRYLPTTLNGRNKGNKRNNGVDESLGEESVSLVSDVSLIQDKQEKIEFPKFPLFGKQHDCDFQMIDGVHRCKHCGVFPPNPSKMV